MKYRKGLVIAAGMAVPGLTFGALLSTTSTSASVGRSGSYVSMIDQNSVAPTSGSLVQSLSMSTVADGAETIPYYNSSGYIVGWNTYNSSSSGSYGGIVASGDLFGRAVVGVRNGYTYAGSATLTQTAGSAGSTSGSWGLSSGGAMAATPALVGDQISLSQVASDPEYNGGANGVVSTFMEIANAPSLSLAGGSPGISVSLSEGVASAYYGTSSWTASRWTVLNSLGGVYSPFRDHLDVYATLFLDGVSVDQILWSDDWSPYAYGNRPFDGLADRFDYVVPSGRTEPLLFEVRMQVVQSGYDGASQLVSTEGVRSASAPLSVAVPEPTTLGIAVCGIFLLGKRQRRLPA